MVAQDQGIFPKGQPISHNQGYAQMPSGFDYVEKALVSTLGPCSGGILSSEDSDDRCVQFRGMKWSLRAT